MRVFLAVLIGGLMYAGPAAKPAAGDAVKGKQVFTKCISCHSPNTTQSKFGPSLKGLYAKAKMKNGQKPTDESVMKIVNDGFGTMPPYGQLIKAEDKAHLLAYLKTL